MRGAVAGDLAPIVLDAGEELGHVAGAPPAGGASSLANAATGEGETGDAEAEERERGGFGTLGASPA